MAEDTLFYVGSNDGSAKESLFLCSLDHESGEIELIESYDDVLAPSYLCLNKDRSLLYTVVSGNPNKVSVWKIAANGTLEFVEQLESGGRGSCHLSLSSDEKSLFVANYSSGQVSVVSLNSDGSFGGVVQVLTLEGTGLNQSRQEASHMHYVNTTLDEKIVLAADLGTDRVQLYEYDRDSGELRVNPSQNALPVAPGAGPRHLAFHPNNKWVYLLNELDATIDFIQYDSGKGRFSKIASSQLMPEDFSGFNKSAAIRIHPNGRFLYGSNRGDSDSITVFEIQEDGQLNQVERKVVGVNWPRDFNIDPSGRYLISGGAKLNQLKVFEIEAASGALQETEYVLNLPKPVCIVFK